jgi:hypothetical protein
MDVSETERGFQLSAFFFIEGLEDMFHDSVWLCRLSLDDRTVRSDDDEGGGKWGASI